MGSGNAGLMGAEMAQADGRSDLRRRETAGLVLREMDSDLELSLK
jgi:hypothetical protein